MECSEPSSSPRDSSSFQYVVGIDIGSEVCSFCVLKPDKSQGNYSGFQREDWTKLVD